MLNINIKILI